VYRVVLLRNVDKWLLAAPAHLQKDLVSALAALGETPRPAGCRKLKAELGWRIRVGNYRVIYEIDDDAQTIVIRYIGPRSAAYRRL
jgi:mRNA interferase RelE/StbE